MEKRKVPAVAGLVVIFYEFFLPILNLSWPLQEF